MTAGVIHFTPRSELSLDENVRNFIELCRMFPPLGADVEFDKDEWDLGQNQRGKNSVQRVIFSTFEAAKEGSKLPVMPEPFLSFGKAVLTYRHDKHPVVSPAVRLCALRCLEASLRLCGKDRRPTAVNATVLDTAVDLAARSYSKAVAYKLAGDLQTLADLMRAKRFIKMPNRWNHGLRRPDELGSRISKEAKAAREEKMPSAAVIRAIGGLFQIVQGVPDTLVSSQVTLLICAPERVNELMRLPVNCIVDHDGRFAGRLGIRWPGSKGADDTTKSIPSKMKELAREAIRRAQNCTNQGRKIAAWYAANPSSVYLHEGALHLRGQEFLTYEQVALLLWGHLGQATSAMHWCRQAKIKMLPRKNRTEFGVVLFAKVQEAVVALLPPTWPYLPGDTNLKVQDALWVVRKNEFHATRAVYECAIDVLEEGDLASRLGQREESGIPSIFTRYGFTEDDGTPINVNTHAFRHYLNMLGHIGGLTGTEIAVLSGRKDERQNRPYDHRTSDELQKPISTAIKERGFMGNLVDSAISHLVNRAEFKDLGAAPAHTTDYGYCLHNFASEPCQMFGDCINCDEQECIKGEAFKEANLKKTKEEIEYLLEQARKALTEEDFGADLWVTHYQQTLKRVNTLLEIMADPKVPIGARIRLATTIVPLVGHTVTAAAKLLKGSGGRALK